MSAPTEAFPLTWPAGKRRTLYRGPSRFRTSLGKAINEVQSEVERLGGSALIISSNLALRRDGMPVARSRAVGDPGVAVYFTYRKKPFVFACDLWLYVEENMWAIAKTINALRGIERWGSGDMMQQAFTGFVALPAPEQPFQILGVPHDASRERIQEAWRSLASKHHPDRNFGDSAELMARINAARDAMLLAIENT